MATNAEQYEQIADKVAAANIAKADAARVALRKRVEAFQTEHKLASYEIAYTRALTVDPEARDWYAKATGAPSVGDYDDETGELIEPMPEPSTVAEALAKQFNDSTIAPLESKLRTIESQYLVTHDDGKGDPAVALMKAKDRLRGISSEYQGIEKQIADAKQQRDDQVLAVMKARAEKLEKQSIAKRAAEDAAEAKRELEAMTPAKQQLVKRVNEYAEEQGLTYAQAYTRGAQSDPTIRALAEVVRSEERAL